MSTSQALAAPPPLTKGSAKTLARQAVREYEPFKVKFFDVSCKRRTAYKRVCSVAWNNGLTSASAVATITRTGTDSSPVDEYRLKGHHFDEYDGPQPISETGRLVVETRRTHLTTPLRLWAGGDDQVDVGVGWPASVASDGEDAPPPGSQWLAFPVDVWNTGPDRFSTSFLNARLVLADGTVRTRARVAGCEPDVDLAGGEYRRVCIGFEIPAGALWDQVEWKAGLETGVWANDAR